MSTKKPTVRMVVAYTSNRCIGKDNDMPWHLPSDLAHFKRVTLGHPIIMGRKTWESIGRALPGRPNYVISRDPSYQAQGATVYATLEEALNACEAGEHSVCCIIGGQQIFTMGLDVTNEVYATEIQSHIEGDTFFPSLDAKDWAEIDRQPQPEENGHRYDFVTYQRKQ